MLREMAYAKKKQKAHGRSKKRLTVRSCSEGFLGLSRPVGGAALSKSSDSRKEHGTGRALSFLFVRTPDSTRGGGGVPCRD